MLASTWAVRSAARATGQVYLGVEPDFPFVAF
jgi:hypothetical protein